MNRGPPLLPNKSNSFIASKAALARDVTIPIPFGIGGAGIVIILIWIPSISEMKLQNFGKGITDSDSLIPTTFNQTLWETVTFSKGRFPNEKNASPKF